MKWNSSTYKDQKAKSPVAKADKWDCIEEGRWVGLVDLLDLVSEEIYN